ncbi:ATP-binding protein [Streptomyces yunnanensis]|uniref:Histidine kinase-like ATPase domain-containing protein n=1 Tax=Streptomyces yunnanensis TaxID=156453 RepID=A0A9X8N8P5_9ACTN|nr:ATP-binding protein [Streptomyces yunnanensis]SHN29544.1 Histidine kinase-like ATPase domain-containing protein [Streptomyces yunnanensis]
MTVTCTYIPETPRRQGPAPGPSASVGTWTLAHRPEAAGEARKITKGFLTQWSVDEDAADSVLLAVSELVTNAVEHARPPLNFQLSRDPGTRRVHIEVSDGGPAAMDGDWAASCTPDEHGRGLEIVDQLTAAHGDREELGRAVHWADVISVP